MDSNCADLTLSIFLYLTVRSPIWLYNYRKIIVRNTHEYNLPDGTSQYKLPRLLKKVIEQHCPRRDPLNNSNPCQIALETI